MKKANKGFTIVELVIVIAVIAILAAVLIPTFAGLIEKANESNDISLAKNLNTALVIAEATGEINTVNDAVKALNEQGFSVGNLNPSAEGNFYVWDSVSNQMLYIDGEDNSVIYKSEDGHGEIQDWWVPVNATAKMTGAFSNFLLTEDEYLSSNLEFDRPVGISVLMDKILYLTGSAKLSVTTEAAGTIVFDGAFNGSATVDAPNCDLYTEGSMTGLAITRIKGESAHINSFIQDFEFVSGHIVLEPQGYIANWIDRSTAAAPATVEIKGVIAMLAEVSASTSYTLAGGTVMAKAESVTLPAGIQETDIGVNEDYAWTIGSREDLIRFRDAVNGGYDFWGVTARLTTDLDLSGINWTANIGSAVTHIEPGKLVYDDGYPFRGTFDGQGHTIKGLTIVNMPKGGYSGYGGGLFGYCENATIKNLKLTDVYIDSDVQTSPLAARIHGCTIDNVQVIGTVKSQWAGGLANYMYDACVISNCVIDVDFTAYGYDEGVSPDGYARYVRLGGVAGQCYDVTILNTDVSSSTFTLEGRKAKVGYFIGGYIGQNNGNKTCYIDYDKDGIAEAEFKGISNNGDSDPVLVGIEEITMIGNTENIDIWTEYHNKPAE